MTNEFNLSQKEIQDLQDHGFATVNGVPLSTLETSWKEGEPWTPETARKQYGGTVGS